MYASKIGGKNYEFGIRNYEFGIWPFINA